MGQSTKAMLQLSVILGAFAALMFWVAPQQPGDVVWAFRFGLPALVLFVCWVLVRNARRVEVLPDILRDAAGDYLERDGLCFAPRIEAADGVCRVVVFFQNRYERACTTQIALLPGGSSFSIARLNILNVNVQFECQGGAFGVLRVPLAIPAAYQGKTIRYDVTAKTRFPEGRGKLLRYRSGAGVGPVRAAGTEQMLEAFSAFSLPPTRVELALPSDVAE